MQKGGQMNFNEFVQQVVKHFENLLGEEYSVRIHDVEKNNGILLRGIMLKKEGQKVTPNIYLNGFYEQYIEENSLEQVMETIWQTYQDALMNFDMEAFDFNLSWEQQKEKIVYRVVNYKENRKKLSLMPHIRFLDLAVTFHCLVQKKQDSVSMLPVTNQIMDYWEVDTTSIMRYAIKNTPEQFPFVVYALEDVIKQLSGENQPDEMYSYNEKEASMFVITNQQGMNGASVILYQKEFQKLVNDLGGKVYILPSSIHEMIVIPYDEDLEEDKLIELVNEVNKEQVPYEEILSNTVYLYDSNTKIFEIL